MIETAVSMNRARSVAGRVEMNYKWCKSCSICVAFCPTKALSANDEGVPQQTNPEKCTGCGLCEMMCPDFAIEVIRQR